MSLLLLLLITVPLGAALALLLLPRAVGEHLAPSVGVAASALTLGVALLTLAARPWSTGTPALELDAPWIPAIGVRLHLVLDGVSAPLVLLTAGLGLAVTLLTARAAPSGGSVRSLVVCLLVVEGGALATFTASDLLLFFVAFEVVLVPMWAVIRW
ncbi:MAG: NADH-quinone oxidoreductase subunit M, partial [Rhodoferax sp.]|nr:NADH-quinone oxidoreductase subunit M [Actinomycetota bacterium]